MASLPGSGDALEGRPARVEYLCHPWKFLLDNLLESINANVSGWATNAATNVTTNTLSKSDIAYFSDE